MYAVNALMTFCLHIQHIYQENEREMIHFIVKSGFYRFNGIYIITLLKILNNVISCTPLYTIKQNLV